MLAAALAVLAYAISENAGSSYGLAHREAARIRLDASAGSLSDALLLRFQDELGSSSTQLMGNLRERLFDQLEAALKGWKQEGSPDVSKITVSEKVPLSRIGSDLAMSDVSLQDVTVTLHDFKAISFGEEGAYATPGVFYGEEAFEDQTRDRLPRDFSGYMTVELQVTTREGGAAVTQKQSVTRDVKVLDLTPPANDFVLFSYGVPKTVDYMLNDLNTGGRMTVFPKGGRVFARGPLFLKVEDAATPTHIGGDLRPERSVSFPERGRSWAGWAFLPTPRDIHMPNFAGEIREVVGSLASALSGNGFVPHPRRPPAAEDHAKGKILGVEFPGVLLLGPALSPVMGLFLPIPLDEQIACALPWVYLTGTVGPGQQRFSISGTPDPLPATGDQSTTSMFSGVRTRENGVYDGTYTEGLRFPHARYADGKSVNNGDAVHPEPFDSKAISEGEAQETTDYGLYGVYKVATFSKNPVFATQIGDLVTKLIPAARILSLGTSKILQALGLDPDIWVILVNWKATAPEDLPAVLEKEFLENKVERKEYFFAPYCLTYEAPQNRELLLEVATIAAATGINLFTQKLAGALMSRIFTAKPNPEVTAVGNKALDKIKDKVITKVQPKNTKLVDRTVKMAQGALANVGRDLLGQQIRAGLWELLSQCFQGAVEGARFVATWKAVGILRQKRLLRVLGDVVAWEPPPTPDLLKREFPKGVYPPKYRPYERIVTRVYDTFDALVADRTRDGVLELGEVMLVRSLWYRSSTPIRYHGRGVILAVAREGQAAPLLDVPIQRADPASHLTLIVEDVVDKTLEQPPEANLTLGPVFEGSLYASSGVQPYGDRSLIFGNLVTLHLNKSKINGSSAVEVVYDTERLPHEKSPRGARDWWILSVSLQSSGLASE